MTVQDLQSGARVPVSRAEAVMPGVLVATFLIFGVGFAHPGIIHDAAHDIRHSAAFPCH